MAAQRYSDYSALFTIFKTVDRFVGESLATSFGLKRWRKPLKYNMGKKFKLIQTIIIGALLILLSSCMNVKSYDLVIHNVKLFDGYESTENATVYIKDGLVENIEWNVDEVEHQYDSLIDGTNKTLIPGLINAHVHIQSSENLKESAKAGILTVLELLRIPEDSIALYHKLGDSSNYAHFYTSGIGADMPDAVIKTFTGTENPYAPTSLKLAEEFIYARIESDVDFIKIFQDSRLPEKFSDSLFDKLVDESQKHDLVTIIHAQTLRDAKYAFDHGGDVVAHLWGDSVISDSELLKWQKREFYISPSLLVYKKVINNYHPKNILTLDSLIQEIGRLHRANIKILAGTDAPNLGINFTTDLFE